VYNKKRNINANVNKDVDLHNTLKNNIAYPTGYDVPVMNLADYIMGKLTEKSKLNQRAPTQMIKAGELTKIELAQSCLDPHRISKFNNSFYVLKN
jgi:hypothetical protein